LFFSRRCPADAPNMNTQPRFVRRAAAGLALAVAGVLLTGCAAHKPAPQVVESVVDRPATASTSTERAVTAHDEQQSVSLRKGQKLVVRLAGQPPRGYAWQISGSNWGNGVVTVDDKETKIDDSGTAVYQFHAVKPGQGTINFSCQNNWDRASLPAKRLVVMVDVD
jgi:predicted secreted protein